MPIKAEHVNKCDCTVTPLPPRSLNQTTFQMRIDLCPLHAAAPELLNALNQAAKLAHKNTRNHSSWLSFRECKQTTCMKATEAIKKAEEG